MYKPKNYLIIEIINYRNMRVTNTRSPVRTTIIGFGIKLMPSGNKKTSDHALYKS